ncbi:MAG: hypothetical protein N2316_12015, partial [Spirochaetes bacterium]|nr:hypothetical protein [Spirochaetota bacterium]
MNIQLERCNFCQEYLKRDIVDGLHGAWLYIPMQLWKKKLAVGIAVIFSTVGGGGLGFFYGLMLKNYYLSSGSMCIYLFAEPVFEYVTIRTMVNSEDENERL